MKNGPQAERGKRISKRNSKYLLDLKDQKDIFTDVSWSQSSIIHVAKFTDQNNI